MITNVIMNFLIEFGTWKISGIEKDISHSWLESVPLLVWEDLKSKIFQSNYSTFQIAPSQSFSFPNNLATFVLDKLFEKDSDDENIVSVVLNILKKCPIDLRKIMANNIFIIGGCALMPQLSNRLINQLKIDCKNNGKLSHLSLEKGKSSFEPSMASWTGASIYSSLQGVDLLTKMTANATGED
jgi:hypothetical protein